MNLFGAVLVVIGTSVVTVAAMLLVRRRAPEGSYFSDGDRASGVFGVLATGFSVLLGFIIFLAFSSYDESRSGAEAEATIVSQQVETAQFLPPDTAAELDRRAGRATRARSSDRSGTPWLRARSTDAINPWGAEMFRTLKAADPQTAAEQSAYDRWMDQTADRQQARVDRIHGAEGIIPLPLWLALFLISGVIFVYMLFFADSGERAKTQALLMGSVTVVICLLLHAAGLLRPSARPRRRSAAPDRDGTHPADHGRPVRGRRREPGGAL